MKQAIKDRLSNKTIPTGWKRVRNIAGTIATIGGLIALAPVAIPSSIMAWISYITIIAGTTAGNAHLTKKDKL